jgi:hypothetical protein
MLLIVSVKCQIIFTALAQLPSLATQLRKQNKIPCRVVEPETEPKLNCLPEPKLRIAAPAPFYLLQV